MSNDKFVVVRKIILPMVALVVLISGLIVGLYLSSRRVEIRNRASGELVNLSVSPTVTTLNPGDGLDITINANQSTAGFYKVTAAAIVVNYPVANLTLTSITPGTYFKPASFSLATQEMLALGISCTQNTDCLTTASGVACTSGWCTNSSITGQTAGQAKFYLGVPCPVSGTACMTDNVDGRAGGNGVIATLHFTAKNTGSTAQTASLTLTGSEVAGLVSSDNSEITTNIAALPSAATNITINPGAVTTVSLPFQVKFQGITAGTSGTAVNCPSRNVRVILKQPGTATEVARGTVATTANTTTAVYSGTLSNLTAGTYDVYLKGPTHIQSMYPNVVISTATPTQVWTSVLQKAGDITGSKMTGNINGPDNLVDLSDWQKIFNNINIVTQVNPATNLMDINCDKVIDSGDLQPIYTNIILEYGPGGEE